MAEEQKPNTGTRESKFHYYSGGEIKEQAGTQVSPWLWGFWTVVIIGAVGYFLFGGALGPNNPLGGGFKPGDSSSANLNKIQQQLNANEANSGTRYASVDLNALPLPAGQTVDEAVTKGSDLYLTYCQGCHGPNQDGNGVNAASLNPKPRNLRDAPFMQAMSYQRITTSLHKGVPGTAMPRWENTLTEAEIRDLIAFVFSLSTPAGPADKNSAASGGSSEFANGSQSSPKPMTPAIGGNRAASTTTAPPSLSGPSPEEVKSQLPTNDLGAKDNGSNNQAQPVLKTPPGAPVPGTSTFRGAVGPETSAPSGGKM